MREVWSVGAGNLLWFRNISKEGIAMLGMECDRNVWKKIIVERIKEYGMR